MNLYFHLPLFIGGLRTSEILIIALIIVLLFGGRKIPELMRGVGRGIRSFKQGMKEVGDEIESDLSDHTSKKDNTQD